MRLRHTLSNKLISIVVFTLISLSANAQNWEKIYRKVVPAVVTIDTYNEDQQPLAQGSGFVVDGNGIIVTNYHVIEGATDARVRFSNEKEYRVLGVIDYDKENDFAILKVDGYKMKTIKMGQVYDLNNGQGVAAIGTPLGLDFTISNGIISQIRDVAGEKRIQHTASISSGNSGGPLVDDRGSVIGINTYCYKAGQNLNFAVPITYIKRSLHRQKHVTVLLPDLVEPEPEISTYYDADGWFSIMAYDHWETAELEGWNEDETIFSKYVGFASNNSDQAYDKGAVHVMVQAPADGSSLSGSMDELKKVSREIFLEGMGAYEEIQEEQIEVEGQSVTMISYLRWNASTGKQEVVCFLLHASTEMNVIVEVVIPEDCTEEEMEVLLLLAGSISY